MPRIKSSGHWDLKYNDISTDISKVNHSLHTVQNSLINLRKRRSNMPGKRHAGSRKTLLATIKQLERSEKALKRRKATLEKQQKATRQKFIKAHQREQKKKKK